MSKIVPLSTEPHAQKNKCGKKVMKLDKTFKTLVVLGSDCFRPYYNTIVDAAYDASCFHLSFSSRGSVCHGL